MLLAHCCWPSTPGVCAARLIRPDGTRCQPASFNAALARGNHPSPPEAPGRPGEHQQSVDPAWHADHGRLWRGNFPEPGARLDIEGVNGVSYVLSAMIAVPMRAALSFPQPLMVRIIGVEREIQGALVGDLGFFQECLVLLITPFVGAMADKVARLRRNTHILKKPWKNSRKRRVASLISA